MTKTGSTAIQEFLAINASALRSTGFVYVPSQGCLWAPLPVYDGWERHRVSLERQWTPVRRALESGMNVVFSDEGLMYDFSRDADRVGLIRELVGGASMEVICYLRRQDIHAESLYKELVKQHALTATFSARTMDDLCGPAFYDYAALTRSLADRVGRDRVHVRGYERRRFPEGDVVRDFCRTAGIPLDDRFTMPERRVNPSVDARLVDYFLAANAAMPVHDQAGQYFNELLVHGAASLLDGHEGRLFEPAEREAFLSRYARSNEAVAREMLGAGDGELFAPMEAIDGQSPRRLTQQQHAAMALFVHTAWAQGLGSVSFRSYNYKKVLHLRRLAAQTSGRGRIGLRLRALAHSLLHLALTGRWPRPGDEPRVDKRVLNLLLRYYRRAARHRAAH
jgi:hypothetical protein